MTIPIEPAGDDELQFQTAEPAPAQATAPATQGCANCSRPLTSEFYAIGPHAICPACRAALDPVPTGTRFTRLLKAGAYGLVAAIVGAVIWYTVRRVTHYEIGLVAILVGFIVGNAVRAGSGNRGGRGYQIIAVVLTYCGIAGNYMPDVAQEMFRMARDDASQTSSALLPPTAATTVPATTRSAATRSATVSAMSPAAAAHDSTKPKPGPLKFVGLVLLLTGLVFAISLAAPFLMGAENIIGLLLIAFALWQAWKLNRRRVLPITGPYQVGENIPTPPGGSIV